MAPRASGEMQPRGMHIAPASEDCQQGARMKFATAIAAACLCAATFAHAGDGYVTGDVDLRAGPDPGYPTIATLNAGTRVSIQGCVSNWSWCDVATATDRGWVAGDFLEEDYEGNRVVVPAFGVQIGIPIITFSFDSYWGAHYHNERYESRPWYAERARWAQIRPRYAPPRRQPISPNAGVHVAPNAGKGTAHPVPRAGATVDQAHVAPVVAPAQHESPPKRESPAMREAAQPAHPEPATPRAQPANTPKPPPSPAHQPPPKAAQHGDGKDEHRGEAKGKVNDEVHKEEKGSDASGKDADPNKHSR
jgi:uncharacterized protein YraI